MSNLRNILRNLLRREAAESDLDSELRSHFELLVDEQILRGLAPAAARRAARLEMGGLDQVKEVVRSSRAGAGIDTLLRDVQYGWRVLRRNPGFAAVAVLTIALGIGANTGIFSIVNSLLLRALPVKDPGRLVLINSPGVVESAWTNPIWEQIRDRQPQLFEGAIAWSGSRFDLAQGGQADFINGLWVSGGFFDVLGVPAILGRTLTPADDRRGGGPDGPVVVISYAFWQARFGGAADVLGRSISLNRLFVTIVGVTPPGFTGPDGGRAYDVAIPLGAEPLMMGKASGLDMRSRWWLDIMVRLKPGQTLAAAERALRRAQPQIREATLPTNWPAEDQKEYLRQGLELAPAATGPSSLRETYRRPLLTILVVVGLVLLIACANIANLLLSRAAGRRHELSVRVALGASRARIIRQLLVETLLLSGLGALLGLLFAQWAAHLLVRQLSTSSTKVFLDLELDWRVLAFTGAVAIGTTLLFGIAPALRATRVQPNEALKMPGRGMTGGRAATIHPLVVAQVALSLMLVVVAGLFTQTFVGLANLNLGFDRDPVLVVGVDDSQRHIAVEQRAATYVRLAEAVSHLPGVANAAASSVTPVGDMTWNDIFEFPDLPALPQTERIVYLNTVTPGWFATYGTRLLAGRDFGEQDRVGSLPVAIVNQAFARKYFGGANPVGRTIQQAAYPGHQPPVLRVVGLAHDAVYRSLRESMPPTAYLPLAQSDEVDSSVNISVRSANGLPEPLIRSVSQAIGGMDPNLSLTFRPLSDQIDASLTKERVVALLSAFFGALALLLAGIGLYGVTSYAVARRRAELGIRIALGASARGVIRLVLTRVLLLVGIGVAIGAAISVWASRFVTALVYGLKPSDPLTLVASIVVLTGVGALAGWLPARRAARIDPVEVLRES